MIQPGENGWCMTRGWEEVTTIGSKADLDGVASIVDQEDQGIGAIPHHGCEVLQHPVCAVNPAFLSKVVSLSRGMQLAEALSDSVVLEHALWWYFDHTFKPHSVRAACSCSCKPTLS